MFNTLNTAVTGMSAAQAGLAVTGHNIANISTYGYSRQRVVTADGFYRTTSISANGKFNQVGSGVSVTHIQQVRNGFLDVQYRHESTKLGYYEVKTMVGEYVEAVSGEMYSDYSVQDTIDNLWDAMQEAVQYPESLDKRAGLVSSAALFMDRMSTAYNDLADYQENLNQQVIEQVEQINHLTTEITQLNDLILEAEANGDYANDYRDSLNVALEELNDIVNIRIEERMNGRIDVYVGDYPLISDGTVTEVGLKYTDPDSGFVEPVFTGRDDIIGYSEDVGRPLFALDGTDGDGGSLLALLEARGIRSETYASCPLAPDATDLTTYPLGTADPQYKEDYAQYKRDLYNVTECEIPKAMKELDQIFNRVATVINDAIAPKDHDPSTAPVGIDEEGTQFLELFVRNDCDRYDPVTGEYIAEDGIDPDTGEYLGYKPGEYPDRSTLYSISNCSINPELLELDGYQKIALSATGDLGNSDAVKESLEAWDEDVLVFADGSTTYNISDGYTHMISEQAADVAADRTAFESQYTLVVQLDNQRQAVMGVSSDEELTNLLKFQRSYQASAKVITMVDSMLDTLINNM